MTSTDRRELGWSWALALLAGVYVAGWGAIELSPEGYAVASWWPAAGLAVALVVLSPLRRIPAMALGVGLATAAANLSGGRDLDLAAAYSATKAVEAVLAGLILKRFRDRVPRLASPEDFLRLVLAAVVGGVVTMIGVGLGVGYLTGGGVRDNGVLVLASHAAAILVITPVALARARGHRNGSNAEAVLQGLATAAVTLLVFAPGQSLPLAFAPLPLLLWGALRFSVRTAAWELALFSVLIILLTGVGHGPFGAAYAEGEIGSMTVAALTQGYVVSAALLTLPFALSVQQRHTLLARVSADERLFRRNFTESLVGMLLMRSEGDRLVIVELNENAVATLGGDRDRLVGRRFDEVVTSPEPLAPVVRALRAGLRDGWSARCTVPARPGARVDVVVAQLSGERDGAIFSVQVLDVTAEHAARQRLEAAERLTSATLDTAACIIVLTDPEGRILRVNAAATAITGHRESDLLGRRVEDTPLAPAAAADIEALFASPDPAGRPVIRERDLVTRDGRRLRVVWNNSVVQDALGSPSYAVMTGVDVTSERESAGLVDHLMRASIATALVGLDATGRISVFNSGATHLLGFASEEVTGERFTELLQPDQLSARTATSDPDRAFHELAATVGRGESTARDWIWVSRTGGERVVSMTLSATRDAFGEHLGYLVVGRDVTEQREGQEMLIAALDKERMAVERLQAVDHAKNEFVSTVSHELRTPLTSIVGYTEMLQDGHPAPALEGQRPLLDTIARNAQRLTVLCDDLLVLAGLDAGSVEWQRETLDLRSVLSPVEEALRPMLSGRRLELIWESDPAPVVVTGDRAQLERALLNLLSNAVKFTDDGGTVACRVRRQDGRAVMQVADTGIGIPVEEQDGLFQKFFRSTTAQHRAVQGPGLGLSIVAGIVAAHDGTIDVESADEKGASFTVRLPLARIRAA